MKRHRLLTTPALLGVCTTLAVSGCGASNGSSASAGAAASTSANSGGAASDSSSSGGSASAASGTGISVTPGKPFSMCVVHNNADDPSITALTAGINQAAKTYHAHVTFFNPAGDPQKQASMIQDCITRKPDVLVVNAVDPKAAVPPVEAAFKKGIKVLTVNANIAPNGQQYIKSFVGSASYNQGKAIGATIAHDLNNHGNIVVIEGNAGQTDTVNRVNGMEDAFKAAGAHINVLAEEPANWERNIASNVMTSMLTRFPGSKLNAVFAEDDDMAQGALQAIQASGRTGIKLYGVNGEKAVCQLIKQGQMAGTALQESKVIGEDAVAASASLVQGKTLPKQILAPTAVVTPQNVNQLMGQCW